MRKFPLNPVAYYTRFRDMVDDLAAKYGDQPASAEISGIEFPRSQLLTA